MIHVLALSVIAVVLRHPEMVEDTAMGPVLPTPLSEVEEPYVEVINPNLGPSIELSMDPQQSDDTRRQSSFSTAHGYHDIFTHRSLNRQDMNVGVVVTFCTFAITLLMVFGAVKGKPNYLMPFFCLQVFDFCIASLTAVGYLCYLPNVHRLVAENPDMPFQEELLRLNPQCLSLLILFTFIAAMMVKAYFIGVVWSCYKYLSLRMIAAQRTIHYIDPNSESLLPDLPDYETAVGDPRFSVKKFPTPPPSYASATAAAVEVVQEPTTVASSPHPQPQPQSAQAQIQPAHPQPQPQIIIQASDHSTA